MRLIEPGYTSSSEHNCVSAGPECLTVGDLTQTSTASTRPWKKQNYQTLKAKENCNNRIEGTGMEKWQQMGGWGEETGGAHHT